MDIKTKFDIGQIVFLATDSEQRARIVTGIIIRPSGIIYYLTCGSEETTHYDIEFTLEKNYIIA